MPTENVVQEKFRQYYLGERTAIKAPTEMKNREYAVLLFDKMVMLRHQSFKTKEEMISFLTSTIPSDVYYSCAYYERPKATMDKKGWLGADLVFDIDADHIPTVCGKAHDTWMCRQCHFTGKGRSPERCPRCSKSKFNVKTWVCDDCLKAAKNETTRLIDMLKEDLGFTDEEMQVYFSGNRGYHVHVESERENVRLLDSMSRKEIVDYVIGFGLKAELQGLFEKESVRFGPSRSRTGWKRRIANGIHEFLAEEIGDKAEISNLSRKAVASLSGRRKEILEGFRESGGIRLKGAKWANIIQGIVSRQSARVDTVVTTDVHRLIRLAGTLHGKTGFKKTHIPVSDLDTFDPLEEAVAFKEGQMVVDVIDAPKFRIGGTSYGPFKNMSNVELPTAAAIFLLCRGAAREVS